MLKNSRWNVPHLKFRLEKQIVYVDLFHNKEHVETLMLVFKHVNQFMENTEIVQLKNSNLELRFVKLDWKTPADQYFPELDFDVIQFLDSDDSRIDLYKHLLDLFHTNTRIQLSTHAGTDLRLVPILENVTEFQLAGSEASSEYAEEYFSKFNDLQSVLVEPILKGQLMENSKLSSAKKLLVEEIRDEVNFIKHFKGQVGSFKECQCDINFIIEIIKLWVSNEAFQNLDYLSLAANDLIKWNENDVLQAVETNPYDPSKRPENYEKSYVILHWDILPGKCAKLLDVTRKTDGKIASIKVQSSFFQLFVWN